MKLTIIWNVWDNYQDTLLGSEIARLSNNKKKLFAQLKLYTQGGYKTPPSKFELKYLDGHLNVSINDRHPLIKFHKKYRGVFRILNGIRQAYDTAVGDGADFAIVTNGDAWCLNLKLLKKLLLRKDIFDNAVSTRIGNVTGLDINFGKYVPFFDDHFMILNINLCQKHKVFNYSEPKAYDSHFVHFGGIHYLLGNMMDERVPQGFFNAYTDLTDCVNHFGERSGYSLLPWQYQPEFSFLHANCHQDPNLHSLRASMLRHHKLDRFPQCNLYCNKYPKNSKIKTKGDYVFFNQSIKDKLFIFMAIFPHKIYHMLLRNFKYNKYNNLKSVLLNNSETSIKYYNNYNDIYPISIASRQYKTKDIV